MLYMLDGHWAEQSLLLPKIPQQGSVQSESESRSVMSDSLRPHEPMEAWRQRSNHAVGPQWARCLYETRTQLQWRVW